MVWNISIGQTGLAAWPCALPALVHLRSSQTLETEKVLDFLAMTKNVNVLSTFFS